MTEYRFQKISIWQKPVNSACSSRGRLSRSRLGGTIAIDRDAMQGFLLAFPGVEKA